MPSKTWDQLLSDADTEGGGFEPLPVGDYDFVVSKAEHGITKANSRTKYDIQAKVISGPSANRVVFHTFTIVQENPKALAFFFRHFAVLGLTRADFFSKNPTDDQVAAALLGKVFRGTLKIDPPYKEGAAPKNVIEKFFTPSDAAVLAAKSVTLAGNSAPSTPSAPTQGAPAQGVPSAPSAAPAAPGVPSAPVAAPPVAAPPAPPLPPAPPIITNTEIPLPPAPPAVSF